MDHNKAWLDQLRWALLVALVATCGSVHLEAQLGPLASPGQAPQAKTQEELDAYLQIVTGKDPQQVINDTQSFASQYPKSELLGTAYQYQMYAFQKLHNFEGLLHAGERALKLHRDNVNTLLTLANAIPNGLAGRSDSEDLLRRAEDYARRALDGINVMRVPDEISLERWESFKGELEARAHEALGQVAMKRGQLREAVEEFEMAALRNPKPRGSQFYRLGMAYASLGEKNQAEVALRRAADLGPGPLRKIALHQLRELTSKKSDQTRP